MDAFAVLGVGGALAVLPTAFALLYLLRRRLERYHASNAPQKVAPTAPSKAGDQEVPMLIAVDGARVKVSDCLLYTSPSPRDS